MLRGLTNVSFWADDVLAARQWYTEVLGIEPYFQNPAEGPPAYIEFRLGAQEDELAIIVRRYGPPGAAQQPGGGDLIEIGPIGIRYVEDTPAGPEPEPGTERLDEDTRTRISQQVFGPTSGPVR